MDMMNCDDLLGCTFMTGVLFFMYVNLNKKNFNLKKKRKS